MGIDTNDDAQLLAYFAGAALNALLSKASTYPPSDSGSAEQALASAVALRKAFRELHPKVGVKVGG